jgi:hypothetical protein
MTYLPFIRRFDLAHDKNATVFRVFAERLQKRRLLFESQVLMVSPSPALTQEYLFAQA